MTIPTQRVLRILLDLRHRPQGSDVSGAREDQDDLGVFGGDIGRAAGLASGTVHPILARLEGAGWVRSWWEDIDPRVAGRPARRFYRLTEAGREQALGALARVRRPARGPIASTRLQEDW